MPTLTEHDAKQFARDFRAQCGGTPAVWRSVMAVEMLEAIFRARLDSPDSSPEWIFANIFGYGKSLDDSYLRDDWRNQGAVNRVPFIAETLFHFQEVEGIDRLIDSIVTGGIESTVAELEALRILNQASLPFRLIAPRSKKGCDYDVEIVLDDSVIACEIKCKLETTKLRETTVVASLKHASKQLPPNGVNVIFLKSPTSWISNPEALRTIDQAIRRLFRNSSRVSAVVLYWSESAQIPVNGQIVHTFRRRLMVNDMSPHQNVVTGPFADKLEGRSSLHAWRSFHQMAEEVAREK